MQLKSELCAQLETWISSSTTNRLFYRATETNAMTEYNSLSVNNR